MGMQSGVANQQLLLDEVGPRVCAAELGEVLDFNMINEFATDMPKPVS
jgi:hypothetical protein